MGGWRERRTGIRARPPGPGRTARRSRASGNLLTSPPIVALVAPQALGGHAVLASPLVAENVVAENVVAENVMPENAAVKNVYVGRADMDAAGDRGWLLGHFKPLGDVRHSEDVEIKWGVHPRGDERAQWVTGEHRTALLILISGRFRVELPGRSVV